MNIGGKLLNTACAICAMTVFWSSPAGRPMRSSGYSVTFTFVTRARIVMDMNMVTLSTPSSTSVLAALSLLGLRKAGTPLEMASTPVSAVQPDEKARASRNTRAAPVNVASGLISQFADSARIVSPAASRTAAVMIMMKIPTMKA